MSVPDVRSSSSWRDAVVKLLTQRRDGVPPLDASAAQALVERMKRLDLTAETVLFREGEYPPDGQERMVVVLKGEVRVESNATGEIVGGYSTLMGVRGPGAMLGEMALLDPSSPRSMTCIADTNVTLAVLLRRDFLQLLSDSPYYAALILQSLAQRLVRQVRELNRRTLTLSKVCEAQAQELAASHQVNRRLLDRLGEKPPVEHPAK